MRELAGREAGPDGVDWRVRLSEKVEVATRIMGVGVWEWDLSLRSFTWDQRTYDLFGLAPGAETLDLSFIFRCVHPQDRTRFAEALQRASAGTEELDVQFRVETTTGRPRHLRARAERRESRPEGAARLIGTVCDITSSQALGEALTGSTRENP